ncbi:MAG: nucleotidyltransferase domain-containing protein [Candidatus Thorarchaeota archaeon]
MDIRKRFADALDDTVNTWKSKKEVEGLFVYGSYVRGTITNASDLDLCVVLKEGECESQLLSEHKGVRIDMTCLTSEEIKRVFDGNVSDPIKISEVVGRLRNAQIVYDRGHDLKKWEELARRFTWNQDHIDLMKQRALNSLERASRFTIREDTVSAVCEIRRALSDIGRAIVMKNGRFSILRPAEVLSEIRLLDPITYQVFLRTFKLKSFDDEEELIGVLSDVQHWLEIAEDRYREAGKAGRITENLAAAQRQYHGAVGLTLSGDYELAVLEMRHAIYSLAVSLLLLDGSGELEEIGIGDELREREPDFYEQIVVEYGAFDFQSKGVERSIGEARFIAARL